MNTARHMAGSQLIAFLKPAPGLFSPPVFRVGPFVRPARPLLCPNRMLFEIPFTAAAAMVTHSEANSSLKVFAAELPGARKSFPHPDPAHGPGGDLMACALLGVLLLPLALIGACIWRIRRHQRHFGREMELVEELMVMDSRVRNRPSIPQPPGVPDWQKSPDWWREASAVEKSG